MIGTANPSTELEKIKKVFLVKILKKDQMVKTKEFSKE